MPIGTLVDKKLLRDHFLELRQQHRGARFQRGYGIGGIFKSLARYAIPLFNQGAKVVGKRALQEATEVDQDVLQGKNVRESVKTNGGKVAKNFAEQGAKTLLCQTGHGRKRRRSQRSNLSSVKKQKLEAPRFTKWITDDESNTMRKAATMTNRIVKRLKRVTIYIRSITL